MASRKNNEQYARRFEQVFNDEPKPRESQPSEPATRPMAAGGMPELFARPNSDHAVGGIFLSGQFVVHILLNLPGIKDPDRWLRRHGAPVALDAGGTKRYVAVDILRWAASRFCPDEQSRRTLLALAESTERGPSPVGIASKTVG